MGIDFKDKLKIMKILSSEEGREKFKEMLELKLKSQQAQQATAKCIAEGLGNAELLSALTLSAGQNDFLPLCVTAVAGGETRQIESVQPADADFDYAQLCEQFNAIVSDNSEEKAEFLQKTAAALKDIIVQKGVVAEDFVVEIG